MDINYERNRIFQKVFDNTGIFPILYENERKWLWKNYGVYIELKDQCCDVHCPGETITFNYDNNNIETVISKYINLQQESSRQYIDDI